MTRPNVLERDNAEDEVAGLCSDLIRFATVNRGEGDAEPEQPAAEHVAALLDEAGAEPVIVEPAPGRSSVLARIAGTDPSHPAFLMHGHLDVVPAEPGGRGVHRRLRLPVRGARAS